MGKCQGHWVELEKIVGKFLNFYKIQEISNLPKSMRNKGSKLPTLTKNNDNFGHINIRTPCIMCSASNIMSILTSDESF